MAIQPSALQSVVNHIYAHCRRAATGDRHSAHRSPFVLGISGLQGSGKSTWASSIAELLRAQQDLKVVVVSLDDFYRDHNGLVKLRSENPTNSLLRSRGQPGTHDEELVQDFFNSIRSEAENLQIPAFDKSRFDGEGDRVPREHWETVTKSPPIDVLIFEGWCMGFQALPASALKAKWDAAHQHELTNTKQESLLFSTKTLADHSFSHILGINENLRRYNLTFMHPSNFDYMLLLDTDNLVNVYEWRTDQERALRMKTGKGMTDTEVARFVRGYMPAYELYLEKLQKAAFIPRVPENIWTSSQLRVTLNLDRTVKHIEEMY